MPRNAGYSRNVILILAHPNTAVASPALPAPASTTKPVRTKFVDQAAQLAKVAARLTKQDVIAFDTEFMREKTFYPQLSLIQVADREQSWVIDPLALSHAEMQPLLDVFASPDTIKVAHAVEQDQECIHRAYGMVVEPILDTAIGAALTGRGDQIGLSPLLSKLIGVNLSKGHSRTNWMKRPLPQPMIEYAADDVVYLVEAAERLSKDLRALKRVDWAMSLSAEFGNATRAEFDTSALTRKIAAGSRLGAASYAVLKELVIWREQHVRQKDIPRRWLAGDQVLAKLAVARPKAADDLQNFRGLGPKLRQYGAEPILAAIRRGESVPLEEYEEPPKKDEPSSNEAAALTVLKCFLTSLAAENKVPLRFLVENGAMLGLLRGSFASVDDLRASGLLHTGTIEMFGQELVAILNGERALGIVGGRATRLDMTD